VHILPLIFITIYDLQGFVFQLLVSQQVTLRFESRGAVGEFTAKGFVQLTTARPGDFEDLLRLVGVM